jgi:multiple sugar transport system permease protein
MAITTNQKKISPALRNVSNGWIFEALVALGALAFLFPVILIFITAFKPDSEIVHFRGILPAHPTLANFKEILGSPEEIPIFHWFMNSMLISSSVTLLVLTVSSMAAYAFARLPLPGKRWVFLLIISTLMIPGQILLVPVYMILNSLGWLDTPLALIIPAGASAFGFFLLHQFFLGIPKDLEEAA